MTAALMTLLEIGAFAFCAIVALTGVQVLLTAWHMRRGTYIRGRACLPDEPLPDELLPVEHDLRGLGFIPSRRIGYRLIFQNDPLVAWCYLHPELNIEASLTPTRTRPPFLAAFETAFADHAALVTWYPRGQHIETPLFLGRFAHNSLFEAYDHHLLTQLLWTEQHGETLPVPEDDVEYLAASEAFYARHGSALFAPLIKQLIGQGIGRLGIALFFVGLVLTLRAGAGPTMIDFRELTLPPLLLMTGLLLAAGGTAYSTRGKPPAAVDADRTPPVDPGVHPLNRPERTK